MQQILFIQKLLPLRERSYNDRQGQPQVFTSQGFVLTDGVNTFYAETTGNYAKAVLGLKLTEGQLVAVQLTFRSSSWQTQQGETRYENAVTISNIAPFGLRVTEGGES